MGSPARLRELRVKVGTTFNTNHANAGGATGWNVDYSTVHKLPIVAFDDSGLTRPGLEDETIQTRMHAKPASIPGLSKGALKFSTYLEGAHANVGYPSSINVLRALCGGMATATNARSGTAGGAVSTVNIAKTSVNTYVVAGQAVLCGVKGDARGGGEVKPINGVSVDHIGISIATSAAVDTADALTFSTTLYPDEDATQQYIDALAIGHATADQRQTVGGSGSFAVSGLGVGEAPKVDVELAVADHQWCPSGSRASLGHSTTADAGKPAFDKSIGLVHIGDHGTSTRTAYKCGDIAFNPGLTHEELPEPSGINGLGGFQHMPGVPTLELTVLMDEDAGLLDDFTNQTAKTVLVQLGHAPTKCVAIELPKAYLDEQPAAATLGNMRGLKLKFHGTEDFVSGNDLRSAAWRLHAF